jgi:hypothetical protein
MTSELESDNLVMYAQLEARNACVTGQEMLFCEAPCLKFHLAMEDL